MRTVQLTFTFSDAEWEALRKVCRLWDQQPTFDNVCRCIKLLCLKGAKDALDEAEALDGMWKEVKEKVEKAKGMSGVKKC